MAVFIDGEGNLNEFITEYRKQRENASEETEDFSDEALDIILQFLFDLNECAFVNKISEVPKKRKKIEVDAKELSQDWGIYENEKEFLNDTKGIKVSYYYKLNDGSFLIQW